MTTTPAPSPGLRLRQAQSGDLPAIHRIEQSAFPQPWPAGVFDQYLGRPGFLVAQDGAVVGYIVADVVDGHDRTLGHVKDLAVRADRRREGIASGLLSRAIEVLSARVGSVKLEVRAGNSGAIELYRRHGFRYRRRLGGYYADGEDALVLVRPMS